MKIALVLLLLGSTADAATVEPFQFLRYGQFYCPEQHVKALERVVDSTNRSEFEVNMQSAIVAGYCTGSSTSVPAENVRQFRTNAGREYLCFEAIDEATRSAMGVYCSPIGSVATISAEIAKRVGDYKITSEDSRLIKAECTEGGSVVVLKANARWERLPLIFPKALKPATRSIPPDHDSALRNGCKGIDYAE